MSQAWWCTSAIPDTQAAKAEREFELDLGDLVRPYLKIKRINKKGWGYRSVVEVVHGV